MNNGRTTGSHSAIPIAPVPSPPHMQDWRAGLVHVAGQLVEQWRPDGSTDRLAHRIRQSALIGAIAVVAILALGAMAYRDYSYRSGVERQREKDRWEAVLERLDKIEDSVSVVPKLQKSLDAVWSRIAPDRPMPPISDASSGATH